MNITYRRRGRPGLYDFLAESGQGEAYRVTNGRVWKVDGHPKGHWCAVPLFGPRVMRGGRTRALAVEALLEATGTVSIAPQAPEQWQGWDAWDPGTVCVMRRSRNIPLVLAVDDVSPEYWPGAFCVLRQAGHSTKG